jgi:hypothetical protein
MLKHTTVLAIMMQHQVAIRRLLPDQPPSDTTVSWWRSCALDADADPALSVAVEQGPKILSLDVISGYALQRILGIDCVHVEGESIRAQDVLLHPILLINEELPHLTGDIVRSKYLIQRMQADVLFPVIWVTAPVEISLQFEPKKTQNPRAGQVANALQSERHLSKGELEMLQAKELGITPAALRKRRSRARARLKNGKK